MFEKTEQKQGTVKQPETSKSRGHHPPGVEGPRKEVVLPGDLPVLQELESRRRLLVGGGSTAEGIVPPRQRMRRNTWPFPHPPISHQ